MSVLYTTLKGTLDPVTLLIVFTNLISYIVIQTIFFQFVGSQNFVQAMVQKADFVYEFVKQDPVTEAALRRELESEYNTVEVPRTTNTRMKERKEKNLETMKKYLLPPVVVIAGLLVLQVVRLAVWGNGINSIDLFLLFMVVFAFTTEFIFYALVIKQTLFVGDQELMAAVTVPALEEQQRIAEGGRP